MSAMTSIAISLAFMVTWHFHRKPETTIGPKITITHERESPLHKPTVQKCWLVRVELLPKYFYVTNCLYSLHTSYLLTLGLPAQNEK